MRIKLTHIAPLLAAGAAAVAISAAPSRQSPSAPPRASRPTTSRRCWASPAPLAEELQTMAAWLGLGIVTVGTKGVLAPVLRRQLSGMSWSPLES